MIFLGFGGLLILWFKASWPKFPPGQLASLAKIPNTYRLACSEW